MADGMRRVVIWLTPEQLAELARLARQAGDSRSAYARRLLAVNLQTQEKENE